MNRISMAQLPPAMPRFGSSNVLPMLNGLKQAVDKGPVQFKGTDQGSEEYYSVNGKNLTVTKERGYWTMSTTTKDGQELNLKCYMFRNGVEASVGGRPFSDNSSEAQQTFQAIMTKLSASKPKKPGEADPNIDIF